MNYKYSTILLLIALLAVVIYHFYSASDIISQEQNGKTKSEASIKKDSTGADDELDKYFSQILANGVDSTTGKFISRSKAKAKLDTMLNYRRNNPRKPGIKNDYGYIFGLEKMRGLIQRIDNINKGSDSVNLTGIRIYRTISKIKGKKYFDVFMIAVTEDNQDYPNLGNPDLPKNGNRDGNHEKDGEGDEDPILNFSTPCPTDCN